MQGTNRIHHLEITVRHDEMARLLGYTNDEAPPRVRSMMEEVEAAAAQMVEPAGVWRELSAPDLAQSRFLRELDSIALCLVTIGPRLEEEVARLKREGELGHALILDTYGSVAAEAAAAAANGTIATAVRERGLDCSLRFSPGYGSWAVDEQRWILPAVDAQALGVTLTEGCMMTPRKSVSFAVTIGLEPIEMRSVNICDSCGAVDCQWRDTPHKCFGRVME